MRNYLKSLPSRISRRHRGSVLILVVVMVVLLALLGTALLSTSRGDRFTSQQHVVSTQIDLLIQGVEDLARAKIQSALVGTTNSNYTVGANNFRLPGDTKIVLAAGNYINFDGIKNTVLPTDFGRDWLESRTPTSLYDGVAAREYVFWKSIGAPLAGDGSFESPLVLDTQVNTPSSTLSPRFSGITDRITTALPSAVPVGPQFSPDWMRDRNTGIIYPAFHLLATGAAAPGFYMAADADGDGIADSGYFRLPVGTIDGVTYFAAVKIIDNNSMINLNTAGSRAFDRTPAGVPSDALGGALTAPDLADNLGWFHSHVGLKEMLNRQDLYPAGVQNTAYTFGSAVTTPEANSTAEMLALDRYRLGYDLNDNTLTPAQVTGSAAIWLETTTDRYKTGTHQDAGSFPDAQFLTTGDSLEHQLTDRLRNTGSNQLSTAGMPVVGTRSFDPGDVISLAYHGGVAINPDAGLSRLDSTFFNARQTNGTLLGSGIADSIYSSAANYTRGSVNPSIPSGTIAGRKQYSPDGAASWFDDNYYADANTAGAGPLYNTSATGLSNGFKYRTMRPYVTTSNPTSQLIPARPLPAGKLIAFAATDLAYWTTDVNAFTDYSKYPSKTSVNTAEFPELWRSYWNVMAEGTASLAAAAPLPEYGSTTAFDKDSTTLTRPTANSIYDGETFAYSSNTDMFVTPADTTVHNSERMFRSVIRDPHGGGTPAFISPEYMVYLRSAIASMNTEQLRVNGTAAAGTIAPTPHQIKIKGFDPNPPPGAATDLTVTIFGQTPQPFITEVYVSTDTQTVPAGGAPNPNGYIAIELYNPYNIPVSLDNCDVAYIDKTTGGSYSTTPPTSVGTFPTGTLVPANGYLIVDNLTTTATYRPTSTGAMAAWPHDTSPAPASINIVHMPLHTLYQHEMFIRRPYMTPPLTGTPVQQIAKYQPLDSFDFTDIYPVNPMRAQIFHYARPSGIANNWRCVYPGRYRVDPAAAVPVRQQGEDISPAFDPTPPMNEPDPWPNGDPGVAGHQMVMFGQTKNLPTYTLPVTSAPPLIQLTNNISQVARNPLQGTGNNFPFGGFAREADILEVPFIGSYVIQDANGKLLEMNSVSMDAAFAEDTFGEDDEQVGANLYNSHEQIGRFCPISDTVGVAPTHNDLAGTPADYSAASAGNLWNYRWATRLFDYLTVRSSAADYTPNVSELARTSAGLANRFSVDNDGDGIGNGKETAGTPVENIEDALPQHGLININTASARVLSALPIFRTGNNWTYTPGANLDTDGVWVDGADTTAGSPFANLDDNLKLAKEIVRWRDGDLSTGDLPHGPFTTLFDLYRVPAFRSAQQHLLMEAYVSPGGPDRSNGDFSDVNDNSRADYEEQFLLMNRISNLITTRSDSYTVYVVVEGWRNIDGKSSPTLVVRRRKAFVQDRWQMTSSTGSLNTPISIPNE